MRRGLLSHLYILLGGDVIIKLIDSAFLSSHQKPLAQSTLVETYCIQMSAICLQLIGEVVNSHGRW